ncbi:HNH endonuclease [Actinoplanes sp. CA-131856]
MRRPLPAETAALLGDKTKAIAASATPQKFARASWTSSGATRRVLKRQLTAMCARPSFCMYCYESRGTDVDHFVPITLDPMLTFEWNNHILACGYCNQQAKKEYFPVDGSGHTLLLDPSVDDSADHMTLSTSGELIDLTSRGAETIAVLGLNTRSELVEARYRSWRGVVRVFDQIARERRSVDAEDVEDLRFQPVVDALHHFAHDVSSRRLAYKAVGPAVVASAYRSLPALRSIFPLCRL